MPTESTDDGRSGHPLPLELLKLISALEKRVTDLENRSSATSRAPGSRWAGNHPWLTKDDDLLRRLHGEGEPLAQIAAKLRRTQGTVNHRIEKLNLRRSRKALKRPEPQPPD